MIEAIFELFMMCEASVFFGFHVSKKTHRQLKNRLKHDVPLIFRGFVGYLLHVLDPKTHIPFESYAPQLHDYCGALDLPLEVLGL